MNVPETVVRQVISGGRQAVVPRQAGRLVLGLALGLLASILALQGTHLEEMWALFGRMAAGPVALSLLLVAITQLAKVFRWQLILGGRTRLAWVPALRSLLVGQAINLLVPARAGDFTRSYWVGRQLSAGPVFAFYAVLVEKAWDVLMLLICLSILLWWGPWPAWLSRSGILIGVFSLIAVLAGLMVAAVWQHRRGKAKPGGAHRPAWLTRHLLEPAGELAENLASARRDGRLAWMAVWSAAIWGLGLASNWAVFAALGLSVHWSAALLILVAIYAGVAVPAPPGRVGLFHYLVILALSAYGVGPAEALACGVLLHLVVVMPLLLAGGVAAWIKP
jgi:uncharacterized protein (TIRG00374 family)